MLETVQYLKTHVTADMVYEEITKKYASISRATVYRNLNQLAKCGEIKRVKVPDGADCFDYQTHKHYHARCLKCNKIVDVDMKYMEHLESKILDSNGFAFYGHELIFEGLCPNCQAKD